VNPTTVKASAHYVYSMTFAQYLNIDLRAIKLHHTWRRRRSRTPRFSLLRDGRNNLPATARQKRYVFNLLSFHFLHANAVLVQSCTYRHGANALSQKPKLNEEISIKLKIHGLHFTIRLISQTLLNLLTNNAPNLCMYLFIFVHVTKNYNCTLKKLGCFNLNLG